MGADFFQVWIENDLITYIVTSHLQSFGHILYPKTEDTSENCTCVSPLTQPRTENGRKSWRDDPMAKGRANTEDTGFLYRTEKSGTGRKSP